MKDDDDKVRAAIEEIVLRREAEEAMEKVAAMTPAERSEALRAAGIDVEKERARLRERFEAGGALPEKEEAKVVSLASRRMQRSTKMLLLVAAAIAVSVGSGIAVVATRDEGLGDTRVAAPLCLVIDPAMTLEGTVVRRGESYELDLRTPLCGREGGLVPTVTLTGAVDPAPLVGRRVKLEGRPLDGDGGSITFEARRAL